MGYPSTVDTGGAQQWSLSETQIAAGGAVALTANTVYLEAVYVPDTTTITGIRFVLGATAAGNVDVGIYDANNNLVAHSGSTSVSGNANSTMTITFSTPVTLTRGRYLLALSPGNSTDTYNRVGSLLSGISPCWTATNNSTGTTSPVLPSSTGTLVNSTIRVAMTAVISGGAP